MLRPYVVSSRAALRCVPMSTWYDQLVGASTASFRLTWIPTLTGCVCAQDCWTALISAAKEGHIEVVRELLENNANLEHRDMVRPHFLNVVRVTIYTIRETPSGSFRCKT